MALQTPSSAHFRSSDLFIGALAGLIATIPMTWALGQIDTSTDDELVADLVRRTGYPLDADGRLLATFVSRFGFGASSGLLFTIIQNHLARVHPRLRAPAFGLGLWFLTSIVKRAAAPAGSMRARDEVILFGSHVIWGFALAQLIQASPREIVFGVTSGVFGQSSLARDLRSLMF